MSKYLIAGWDTMSHGRNGALVWDVMECRNLEEAEGYAFECACEEIMDNDSMDALRRQAILDAQDHAHELYPDDRDAATEDYLRCMEEFYKEYSCAHAYLLPDDADRNELLKMNYHDIIEDYDLED